MSAWMTHRARALLAVAGLGLATAGIPFGPVSASGLQVMPTSLTLQAARAADGLWLRNTGDAPLNAQVRVYRWTQTNGKDRLEPTRALVASPPMLKLDAGKSQLIRVIRTGAPPARGEAAFRIVVNELPVDKDKGGLNFVLRYSIPVFVQAAGSSDARPELSWSLERKGNQLLLGVRNDGKRHAQISDVSLVDAAGKRHQLKQGLLGYVLPGMHMHWELKPDAAAMEDGASLNARVNGEPVSPTVSSDTGSR